MSEDWGLRIHGLPIEDWRLNCRLHWRSKSASIVIPSIVIPSIDNPAIVNPSIGNRQSPIAN